MMDRRSFLKATLATGIFSGLGNSSLLSKSRGIPNVVMIMADDLGWGDLGCYGHHELRTPNIDKLAEEGTLFTQYYVASPVCSPSRACLMTGQFPARLKVHRPLTHNHSANASKGCADYIDPNVVTIGDLLKNAGYTTAHIGKWHVGHTDDAPHPNEYGIDYCRTVNANVNPHEKLFRGDRVGDPFYMAKSPKWIVDDAIEFVEQYKDEPFYINVHMIIPHTTLRPTAEQLKAYDHLDSNDYPGPEGKQIYYSALTDMDRHIGRLMNKLEQLGLKDDTIVIFTSDNGPENVRFDGADHSGLGSSGPLRGHKCSLYEGGVRVPFVIRWPGKIKAGRVDSEAVLSGADLMPSLCHCAGAAMSGSALEKIDGEDMYSVLMGGSKGREKPLFWEYRYDWYYHKDGAPINLSPSLAIRDGDFKLLMNHDQSRLELYNLSTNCMEVDNVANQHPEVVKKLKAKLFKWVETLPPGPRDPNAGKIHKSWPR